MLDPSVNYTKNAGPVKSIPQTTLKGIDLTELADSAIILRTRGWPPPFRTGAALSRLPLGGNRHNGGDGRKIDGASLHAVPADFHDRNHVAVRLSGDHALSLGGRQDAERGIVLEMRHEVNHAGVRSVRLFLLSGEGDADALALVLVEHGTRLAGVKIVRGESDSGDGLVHGFSPFVCFSFTFLLYQSVRGLSSLLLQPDHFPKFGLDALCGFPLPRCRVADKAAHNLPTAVPAIVILYGIERKHGVRVWREIRKNVPPILALATRDVFHVHDCLGRDGVKGTACGVRIHCLISFHASIIPECIQYVKSIRGRPVAGNNLTGACGTGIIFRNQKCKAPPSIIPKMQGPVKLFPVVKKPARYPAGFILYQTCPGLSSLLHDCQFRSDALCCGVHPLHKKLCLFCRGREEFHVVVQVVHGEEYHVVHCFFLSFTPLLYHTGLGSQVIRSRPTQWSRASTYGNLANRA